MKAYQIKVTGVVQGIGYRYFTRMAANRLGICGWVRNCPDGSVEVFCEGEAGSLEMFVEEVRKGPSGLIAKTFQVVEASPTYIFGFEICV